MKKNIIVTCSVFKGSIKVIILSFPIHELWFDYLFTQAYGDDSPSRALPVQRNPVKIVFSDAECDEVFRQGNFSHWSNVVFPYCFLTIYSFFFFYNVYPFQSSTREEFQLYNRYYFGSSHKVGEKKDINLKNMIFFYIS